MEYRGSVAEGILSTLVVTDAKIQMDLWNFDGMTGWAVGVEAAFLDVVSNMVLQGRATSKKRPSPPSHRRRAGARRAWPHTIMFSDPSLCPSQQVGKTSLASSSAQAVEGKKLSSLLLQSSRSHGLGPSQTASDRDFGWSPLALHSTN